jgi:hypothetical protein
MNTCIHCGTDTKNAKFCSQSCSAKHNNKGVRRHGKDTHPCAYCGNPTRRKYCSIRCGAEARKLSEDHLKKSNAIRQSRYRAKQYRVLDPTANAEKIKEIYCNCPEGHEVDHIIPLSKGGKHHENNLQYLTIRENRSKSNRW